MLKNKKKIFKRIFNLIIILMFALTLTNVFALNTTDIKNGATNFINDAKSSDFNGQIAPTMTTLADLMMGIGVMVLIITGLMIAIKTMSDGAYGKAQLKEALTPYFIGCIVIISGWTIWKIVVSVMQNL